MTIILSLDVKEALWLKQQCNATCDAESKEDAEIKLAFFNALPLYCELEPFVDEK